MPAPPLATVISLLKLLTVTSRAFRERAGCGGCLFFTVGFLLRQVGRLLLLRFLAGFSSLGKAWA